jgi:hypothetical protein
MKRWKIGIASRRGVPTRASGVTQSRPVPTRCGLAGGPPLSSANTVSSMLSVVFITLHIISQLEYGNGAWLISSACASARATPRSDRKRGSASKAGSRVLTHAILPQYHPITIRGAKYLALAPLPAIDRHSLPVQSFAGVYAKILSKRDAEHRACEPALGMAPMRAPELALPIR